MKAKAVKMADGVYWVGVIHWHKRTFHGYGIPVPPTMHIWYSVRKRPY